METERLGLAGLLAVLTAAPLAIALSSDVLGVRIGAYILVAVVWLAALVVAWPAARRILGLPMLKTPYLRLFYGKRVSFTFKSAHDEVGWNCPYCGTSTVGLPICTDPGCQAFLGRVAWASDARSFGQVATRAV